MVDDNPTDNRTNNEPIRVPSVDKDTHADQFAREDGILTPEELAETRRELRELDEGRAVISTDSETPSETAANADEQSRTADVETRQTVGQESDRDTGADSVTTREFGIDIAVTTSGSTAEAVFASNDIRVVFTRFLRWYAGEIDASQPPEEVLATLITASDLDLECQ